MNKLLPSLLGWGAGFVVTALAATYLIVQAPHPDAAATAIAPLAVPVTSVTLSDVAIPVISHGRVSVTREHQLSAAVSGRVLEISKAFVNGAHIEKGTLLLRTDPRPYELEVHQRQSDLDRMLLQLEETRALAEVARSQSADSPFARYIPQMRFAESQAAAAREALKFARQQLRDTRVYAPVSGRITGVMVQPGQQVSAATVLGLIQDDSWQEIRLPVSDHEAHLLGINADDGAGDFSQISVSLRTSEQGPVWPAKIVRSEAERGQFQQIILVAHPDYSARPGTPHLLAGTFISAEIRGAQRSDVRVIPRSALQADDRLLLLEQGNRIVTRDADIIHRGRDLIYLSNDLPAGTLLVNSRRQTLLTGTQVTPVNSDTLAATPENF
ncbi:efflux RND transporter periplasmic adaptor subunit [Thalassolituus marinus]|uniref:Efflux RND transporter periplasmic adaptor subunit n=1 Tax=Thalassolituus marinus TaxID=671053 RepID=A0ABS7ZQA1_9GAMM|nr:efflux RND transporter periplasmic adaptor subunit [Thalassolituus marinus]MCA6063891.1 efflux RND transporter periplasmic adaptor subunit [Thalassolituus marinus]